MDEIASLIGVKPRLWKYFVTDFALWRALAFGTFSAYQFRLEGPNRWPDARDAIMQLEARVRRPFKPSSNSNISNVAQSSASSLPMHILCLLFCLLLLAITTAII